MESSATKPRSSRKGARTEQSYAAQTVTVVFDPPTPSTPTAPLCSKTSSLYPQNGRTRSRLSGTTTVALHTTLLPSALNSTTRQVAPRRRPPRADSPRAASCERERAASCERERAASSAAARRGGRQACHQTHRRLRARSRSHQTHRRLPPLMTLLMTPSDDI